MSCAVPLGLFFGRIANFINGELYGRVSNLPWAVIFPHAGPLPRHPSQLYQAGFEGLLLGLLLFALNLVDLRLGRAFRAIKEGEDVARLFAVDIKLYKIKLFVVSSVFASLSGTISPLR